MVGIAFGVPSAPITSPAFGDWLKAQRGDRSHEAMAIALRPHLQAVGLKVHASQIVKLEQGRVPSWPMLIAISQVTHAPIAELAERVASSLELTNTSQNTNAQTGRVLLRPSSDVNSAPQHQGGVVVAEQAETRVFKPTAGTVRDLLHRAVDSLEDGSLRYLLRDLVRASGDVDEVSSGAREGTEDGEDNRGPDQRRARQRVDRDTTGKKRQA